MELLVDARQRLQKIPAASGCFFADVVRVF
jgi:hypothetical protein